MKPTKIENEEILKAINSGNGYIQVDGRKFLLLEVEKIDDPDDANVYLVTDSEEERQILNALKENNPILSDKEIELMLGTRNEG